MLDPNGNENARARMRQQQYIRLALLICMTMLLMDSNNNNSSRRGGRNAPSRASGASGSIRGKGANAVAGGLMNQRFAVHLDPDDTKDLNALFNLRFPTSLAKKQEDYFNISGVYRGMWSHTTWGNISFQTFPSRNFSQGKPFTTMKSLSNGNSLVQLRSVPIVNVPGVMFVYGILKVYDVPVVLGRGVSINGNGVPVSAKQGNSSADSSKKNAYTGRISSLKSTIAGRDVEDISYPIQGIHIPQTSECVLVVTPSRSHRVYVGVPSTSKAPSHKYAKGNQLEKEVEDSANSDNNQFVPATSNHREATRQRKMQKTEELNVGDNIPHHQYYKRKSIRKQRKRNPQINRRLFSGAESSSDMADSNTAPSVQLLAYFASLVDSLSHNPLKYLGWLRAENSTEPMQSVLSSAILPANHLDLMGDMREFFGGRPMGSTSLLSSFPWERDDHSSFEDLLYDNAEALSREDDTSENENQLFYEDRFDGNADQSLGRKLGTSSIDSDDNDETSQYHQHHTRRNEEQRLSEKENNLFLIQHHLTVIPTDSFMKAVKSKATADLKKAEATRKPSQSGHLGPISLREIFPFFYAERYSFSTVKGLELILVDVDSSTRPKQLTGAPVRTSNKNTPPSAKKPSTPASSIPGGLGAATMSNSFLSFVTSIGLSSQWLKTIRCTFALRIATDSPSVANGGHGTGNETTAPSNGSIPTFSPRLLPLIAAAPPARGNKIRQLHGSLYGSTVMSPSSFPSCSGGQRNGSDQDSSTSSSSRAQLSDQFSIIVTNYKVNFEALETKLSTYTFIFTAVCFSQCFFLVTQMIASSNPAAAARVSILSISAMAVLDAAICILHLLLSSSVSGSSFYFFLWISFLKLIVFCILEMRFVISIYQARYSQAMTENGWAGLRNHLATLHARFYGALFLVVLLVDWYYTRPVILVFLLYSFWVPQIVFSAYTGGSSPPLSLEFTVLMTISRLFFPLYILACPENFISMLTEKYSLSLYSAKVTVGWLGFQLLVIVLQHKFGVRFFVPKYFLPVRYNYSRSISHLLDRSSGEDGTPEIECVICYNPIEDPAHSGNYMVTPCDHVFHEGCLQQWLEVKLECPVCRTALPIVED